MNEDRGDILVEDITCFEETRDDRDFEPISKVTPQSKDAKTNRFKQLIQKLPWSVILLALTRVVLQLVSFCFIRRNPSVIKADGTTALNRIVRINKFLKYPYVPNKVPVLSIVLTPFNMDSALSMLSALGLIVATILLCLRLEGRLSQKRSNLITASVTIISFCLLNTAVDLTHCLGSSFTHLHLLQANVGTLEAVVFLLISITINLVQWVLWYGGLQFQKSLLLT